MHISLRRGEKIFLNGAVIRVDRKVCLELLNDVHFLLENHIIQPNDANSPLKQLYLCIQTILMAPMDANKSFMISLEMIRNFLLITNNSGLIDCLLEVKDHLETGKPFEALKTLRIVFQTKSELTDKWDDQLTQHNI